MKLLLNAVLITGVVTMALLYPSNCHALHIINPYTKIYEGVEYATGITSNSYPRLERAWALRVSLRNPDISLVTTPSNGSDPYEVLRKQTDQFLSVHGCEVAVNASFGNASLSPNSDAYGLVISSGNLVSSPQASPFNSQLSFTAEKVATLIKSSTVPTGIDVSVAGAEVILTGGSITTGITTVDPHTAYGLSQDGKYLIMVCVDGRQPGWSEGCDYVEMAQWLLNFGAWDGVMMDGGGSTCMVRKDTGVVNRPSDGTVRAVIVNLGVRSVNNGTIGPSASRMNANRLDVVSRGNLNHVNVRTWTSAGGWDDIVDIGGSTEYSPACISCTDGRLDVFYRGASDHLKTKTWTVGTGWSTETDLGGTLYSGVAACSQDTNNIEVVYRGSSNSIKRITWNGTTWGSVQTLDGGADCPNAPAIVSRVAGRLDVFYRASDNTLKTKYSTGGTWSAPQSLGGSISTAPAVCSRDANHIDVFAASTGGYLHHLAWDNVNGWGSWESLGGQVGKVGSCSTDSNSMEVYYRGTDDHLYEKAWTSVGGWAAKSDLGPYF
jgi:hypothetical protein